MGASKLANYSQETIQLSTIARALAHPARIEIITYLKHHPTVTGIELINLLKLSKSTVIEHVSKLKRANLVKADYYPHCYQLSLIHENIRDLSGFISN